MVLIYVSLVLLPALAAAFDCTGRPYGHYEVSCKTYVLCSGGVAYQVECQSGYVYANYSLGCYEEGKVGPPCGKVMDCSNKPDGKYADVDNGCKSYYVCNGGLYYGHHYCPEGLVFDRSLQICTWPDPSKPCV